MKKEKKAFKTKALLILVLAIAITSLFSSCAKEEPREHTVTIKAIHNVVNMKEYPQDVWYSEGGYNIDLIEDGQTITKVITNKVVPSIKIYCKDIESTTVELTIDGGTTQSRTFNDGKCRYQWEINLD